MEKYISSPRNGSEKYNNLMKFATNSDLLKFWAYRIQIITEKCMTK
jgi:hypothetical protein